MMIGFETFKEAIQSLNIHTSIELAHYLLENYDVSLLPGSDFGFKPKNLKSLTVILSPLLLSNPIVS